MSQTPVRTTDTTLNFTPKELKTPNKDHPGISKTVFTHISNLHNLLNDWIHVHEKGTKICKTISALRLHECKDDYYPHQLKPLTDTLINALESFSNIVEGVGIIDNQLQALAKLHSTDQPVIFTWSANQISENVSQMHCCLQKEYRLKKVITENIAHCRNENLMEVYASSWELEAYFDVFSNAYLFADVGLADTDEESDESTSSNQRTSAASDELIGAEASTDQPAEESCTVNLSQENEDVLGSGKAV